MGQVIVNTYQISLNDGSVEIFDRCRKERENDEEETKEKIEEMATTLAYIQSSSKSFEKDLEELKRPANRMFIN